MLPKVVLDPTIFWLLNGQENALDSERFLSDGINWLRGEAVKQFRVLVSGRMLDRLQSAGYFPAEPHFKIVLAASGLNEIVTARHLATDVARFLSRTNTIEEECPVQDCLLGPIVVDEDIFSSIEVGQLREISAEICALTAANVYASEQGAHSYYYGYSRDSLTRNAISVSAELLSVQPDCFEQRFGNRLDASLRVLNQPQAYFSFLKPEDVWSHADTAAELALAIRLKAEHLVAIDGRALRNFSVGTEFFSALQAHRASKADQYASMVLDKCASIVANLPNVRAQDMRTTAKRTSPTRIRPRDMARARRVKITGSHEALRLMFWETEHKIEFACVRNKFDLTIDEGS